MLTADTNSAIITTMSDTLHMKGEAQRVRTTGKITRFLMDNPKADFDQVSKATGLSVTTIKRYWDDACYAVKLNKSRTGPNKNNRVYFAGIIGGRAVA